MVPGSARASRAPFGALADTMFVQKRGIAVEKKLCGNEGVIASTRRRMRSPEMRAHRSAPFSSLMTKDASKAEKANLSIKEEKGALR